jgi:arylsulfatase A-like enzyme
VLEVTGAAAPAGIVLDGTSYAGLLAGRTPDPARAPLFWLYPGYLGQGRNGWRTTPAGAIRAGDWKLLEFFEDGHLELYNLREDIGERRNLAGQQANRAAALRAQLAAWREQVKAPMPGRNENGPAPAAAKP